LPFLGHLALDDPGVIKCRVAQNQHVRSVSLLWTSLGDFHSPDPPCPPYLQPLAMPLSWPRPCCLPCLNPAAVINKGTQWPRSSSLLSS